MSAVKRLTRELQFLSRAGYEEYITLHNQDILWWNVKLFGPGGSLYENGTFMIEIKFPEEYPYRPPLARFLTKIFHPNIDASGGICLNILQDGWVASRSVKDIIQGIEYLLCNPNPDDPLTPEAGKLFRENPDGYRDKVEEYIRMYN